MIQSASKLAASLSLCAALLVPLGVAADVDANGPWLVRGDAGLGVVEFIETWTHIGSDVTSNDGQTDCPWIGTIDSMTGHFDQTRTTPPLVSPFDPQPNCGQYPLCGPPYGDTQSERSGSVAADGKTFLATGSSCVSVHGCICFDAIWEGSRCGNSVLDDGEQCDDANANDGDGCDHNCQVETCYTCSGLPSVCSQAAGCPCDDGDPCTTADVSDGSGGCAGVPDVGAPCEDGILCTSPDACDANANCVGVPAIGLACDDANDCTEADACDANAVCTGAPIDCSDGLACTADSCEPGVGCVHERPNRACRAATESQLRIRQESDPARDTLIWKWRDGLASFSEFSDPTSTASYTLCVYAGGAAGLVGEATVTPSTVKWNASMHTNLRYRDLHGAEGGIRRILLHAGTGDADITVRGKGEALFDPTLPLALPVSIELGNDDNGICWSAIYGASDIDSNDSRRFRAEHPQ